VPAALPRSSNRTRGRGQERVRIAVCSWLEMPYTLSTLRLDMVPGLLCPCCRPFKLRIQLHRRDERGERFGILSRAHVNDPDVVLRVRPVGLDIVGLDVEQFLCAHEVARRRVREAE